MSGQQRRYGDVGWSANRVLQAYGLRIVGRSLDIPLRRWKGGRIIMDEEAQAVKLVQSISGYDLAEPILRWVYAEGYSPSEFRPNLGEELHCRRKWGIGPSFDIQLAAIGHYREFIRSIEAHLKENPFTPVLYEDEDAV